MLEPPWRAGAPSYGESWNRNWLRFYCILFLKETITNICIQFYSANRRLTGTEL